MAIELYTYKATLVKIKDGDTIVVKVDLGFDISYEITVRMADYDAPETYKPKTEAERAAGYKCKDYFTKLLTENPKLYLKSYRLDIYGRYSCEIWYKNEKGELVWVNELMRQFIKDNNFSKEVLRAEK